MLLAPVAMADLDEIAALHADERVWRHRPNGRHTSVEQTRVKVLAMEQQWAYDGLGYWTARLREPLADLPAGAFVGVGGCAISTGTTWWNLYYRFRPESHGHGLATELSRAALAAARSTRPVRPVVAYLLEENVASKATAERASLDLQWRGSDAGDPDAVRLVYADRPLDPDQLDEIIRHP
jgi:RimJ/RimL family protein N-acetyltransferase